MKSIIDVFKSFDDFVSMEGASDIEIEKAEQELGVIFAEEYKDYLREYGAACANGHEITGITKSKRLSVVEATKKAKSKNINVPKGLYLLEDAGVDHLLIWADDKGRLYQTVGTNVPEPVKKSFEEYIME